MYSVIAGIYAVVFLAEALLLVYIGSQRRSTRAYVGAVLGLIGFALVVTPDSTFFNWMTAFGEAAPYVASLLYVGSKVGLVTYGLLIVIVALIGSLLPLAAIKPNAAKKPQRR